MSNENDIQDIVAQLQNLQLQQAVLIQRLERLSEAREDNRDTIATATDNTTRRFAVGDRVLINNPGPFQATKGTISKIGNSRITVQARNGSKITRAPHNLTLDHE
jgi:transcription antitermination factor NusG